jgi:hypothetical protein
MNAGTLRKICLGSILAGLLLMAGCDPGTRRVFYNATGKDLAVEYPRGCAHVEVVPPGGTYAVGALLFDERLALHSPGKPVQVYEAINCEELLSFFGIGWPRYRYQIDSVSEIRLLRLGQKGPVPAKDRQNAFDPIAPEKVVLPERPLWARSTPQDPGEDSHAYADRLMGGHYGESWTGQNGATPSRRAEYSQIVTYADAHARLWRCNWPGFPPEFEGTPSTLIPGFPEDFLAAPGGEVVLTAWRRKPSQVLVSMRVNRHPREVAAWCKDQLASGKWKPNSFPNSIRLDCLNEYEKEGRHFGVIVEASSGDTASLTIVCGDK